MLTKPLTSAQYRLVFAQRTPSTDHTSTKKTTAQNSAIYPTMCATNRSECTSAGCTIRTTPCAIVVGAGSAPETDRLCNGFISVFLCVVRPFISFFIDDLCVMNGRFLENAVFTTTAKPQRYSLIKWNCNKLAWNRNLQTYQTSSNHLMKHHIRR